MEFFNPWKQYYEQRLSQVSPQTKHELLWKSGIYALVVSDEVVYVGKSKNILQRWISHEYNTFCSYSKDYNSKKYKELRKAYAEGRSIEPRVLEFCSDEQLSARESYWVKYYMPKLNSQLPKANGGYYKGVCQEL